jgi:hypothetical protein
MDVQDHHRLVGGPIENLVGVAHECADPNAGTLSDPCALAGQGYIRVIGGEIGRDVAKIVVCGNR